MSEKVFVTETQNNYMLSLIMDSKNNSKTNDKVLYEVINVH